MSHLSFTFQLEKNNSIQDTFKSFIKKEGFSGITKGLSARLASTIPTAAIMVTTYEYVKRLSLKDNYL